MELLKFTSKFIRSLILYTTQYEDINQFSHGFQYSAYRDELFSIYQQMFSSWSSTFLDGDDEHDHDESNNNNNNNNNSLFTIFLQ